MPVYHFQEAPEPIAQRRMRTGHILRPPALIDGTDNLYVIRCHGVDPETGTPCGWFSAPFMKGGQQQEEAERAAWLHRTEPTLLVSGSSDILHEMRNATVQDLVAKQRREQ